MKKVIGILLAVVVTAAGVLYFISQKKEKDIASLLPESTFMFINFKAHTPEEAAGYTRKIKDFQSALQDIDWETLAEKFITDQRTRAQFDAFKEKAGQLWDTLRLSSLFKSITLLGQITVARNTFTSLLELLNAQLENLFLVIEDTDGDIINKIAKNAETEFNLKLSISNIRYRGRKIVSLGISGRDLGYKLYYASLGKFTVAGLSRDVIEKFIDVSAGRRKSLLASRDYLLAKDKIKKNGKGWQVVGYVSGHGLYGQANIFEQMLTAGIPEKQAEAVDEQLKTVNGFLRGINAIASGIFLGDNEIKQRTYLLFDQDKFSTQVRDDISNEIFSLSGNPQFVKYLPQDFIVCYWTKLRSLSKIWNDMAEQMSKESGKSAAEIENDIKTQTGLSVQDVISAFGNETAVFLEDVNISMFPLPKVAVFIKIKDRASAENIVQSLLRHLPQNVLAKKTYKNTNVSLISIGPVQISVCFMKDFLVIGLPVDTIRDIIDISEGKNPAVLSAVKSASVKAALVDKRNLNFILVNGQELLDKIEDIVNWGSGTYSAFFAKSQNFKKEYLEKLNAQKSALEDELAGIEKQKGEITSREGGAESPEYQQADKHERDIKQQLNQINGKMAEISKPSTVVLTPQLVRAAVNNLVSPFIDALRYITGVSLNRVFVEKDCFVSENIVSYK